ncbi:hypothetical protein VTH06DRAFT_4069 [Thermothelomyces fergusii]|jgi:CheY-like chemotaxis protein
MTYIS